MVTDAVKANANRTESSVIGRAPLVTVLLFVAGALESMAQPVGVRDVLYEEVLVIGGADQLQNTAGSASLIDEEQILAFDTVDINNLLRRVPGVYLRVEDGFGLRPNIGLRGATSERSQKITLMEDGVLIAPAPYSAPAAYYLPNVNRMSSVEVFKGPSAIKSGPHTVGGALNLVTPGMSGERQGKLEAFAGTTNFQKYRLFYGETKGQWSYWIDGLRFGSDGFKDLDSGGDTGFVRNDVNGKLQWRSSADAGFNQSLQLKLGYADEESDEAYLGLTDSDFGETPNRRYLTSALDVFDSEHYQAHLFHFIDLGSQWQLTTRAYFNEFSRDWFKFDGFIGNRAPAAAVVLANPDFYTREIALLRGEVDSNGSERETIDVTDFIRDFVSTGVDLRLKRKLTVSHVDHNLEFGLRYHYDSVQRKQDQQGFLVRDGELLADGVERPLTLSNDWETDAVAAYISDNLEFGHWSIDLGLRYEYIDGRAENRLNGVVVSSEQDVLLPGIGVYYQLTDAWGVLLGVNKGFSPASPGAAGDVDPEESINYEYGVRYSATNLQAELIGFFNDYENLLGRCRVSDLGCVVGEEFNGGGVEIAGAEFALNYTHALGNGLTVPLSVAYTYTETAFQTTFTSNFSQWNPGFFDGVSEPVLRGDELPYTPEHQARIQLGLQGIDWGVDVAARYISEMREVPGVGSFEAGESTPSYTIVDLSADFAVRNRLTLKMIVENLFDESVIVSRRPFGARPNLSRQFKVGLTYQL
ncbi:MAG: TonB-dependent receptor [Pseudomonadota bacterium]